MKKKDRKIDDGMPKNIVNKMSIVVIVFMGITFFMIFTMQNILGDKYEAKLNKEENSYISEDISNDEKEGKDYDNSSIEEKDSNYYRYVNR